MIRSKRRCFHIPFAYLALVATVLLSTPSLAQVKPGDRITPENAAQIRNLVSPGTYVAVTKGMEIDIVRSRRIDWPQPYKVATEKYSRQVQLSADHRTVVGYVAGQPFPMLDTNDPYVATKIMWDSALRPIATDDFDLRFFECQVVPFNPGGEQKLELYSEAGHAAGYFEIGRTEVEPLPADPDFLTSGIWWRQALYPVISPPDGRGNGALRFRYWDPEEPDNTWAFLAFNRRLRRVTEDILSGSPGLTTWDADHAGGFNAKPQEYNYKFLGDRTMLGCVHARNSPAHPCLTDGRATSCPEDWEMRHMFVIEVTPRPERASGILQSKTIVYGISLSTYTGWGTVTYWNAYVANTQMHGKGSFFDPRLKNGEFPVGKAGFDNLRNSPDVITAKLAALHFYQLAIPAPKPSDGSFDKQAAARGKRIFEEKARCATCHVPPLFVEPGWPMHTAAEMGIDDFQANRSPDKRYRTAPLKGLWAHQKGGFFHDGRFATLRDVVEHYNSVFERGLNEQDKVDLVEYLKSL